MSLQLTESQLLLQRTVRDFAEKEIAPKAMELDEREEFPFEIFEGLRELGLTGIGIDPEVGGSGGGVTEGMVAMEEICRAYAGIGTILAVQFGLWGQLVQQFGNDEQRRAFLSPLTQGDMITAFALTEPDAGSDAAAIQTTARRQGDEYVLNGAKTFITCGDVATHLLVIATMDPSLRHKGITCFVVPQSAEGLTTNKQRGKLGVRASTTAEVSVGRRARTRVQPHRGRMRRLPHHHGDSRGLADERRGAGAGHRPMRPRRDDGVGPAA